MPGVVEVSGTTQLPLTGARDGAGLTIEGRTFETPGSAPVADRFVVRPDYFSTLRIPLIAGRVIDGRDGTAAPPVAVIGRTMAAELWPGEDPLGRRIRVAGGPGNPFRTIVGIVGDVKHYGLHLPATMQVYVPHAQTHYAEPTMYMTVRVATDRDPLAIAAAAREHVRALDPLQPVTRLRTYDDIVAESTAARRFTLLLLALFGGTALLLAIVGLYGALSYVVTQRRREIGVRVALGARGGQIAGLVLRQGLRPAVAGVAAGLVCSLLAGRAIETMLYATSPRDAATYAGVFAIIMVAALAACLIPARSAAAVDPAVTLKAD
jgi:putative ABC transport system permease protein